MKAFLPGMNGSVVKVDGNLRSNLGSFKECVVLHCDDQNTMLNMLVAWENESEWPDNDTLHATCCPRGCEKKQIKTPEYFLDEAPGSCLSCSSCSSFECGVGFTSGEKQRAA